MKFDIGVVIRIQSGVFRGFDAVIIRELSDYTVMAEVDIFGKKVECLVSKSDLSEDPLRDALRDLMSAYERHIRSLCTTPEELAAKPWECSEYLAAKRVLDQPV